MRNNDSMKYLHEQEKENLKRLLSLNGKARGKELETILDTFLASEEHQSVEDLQERLKSRGLKFDRETVQDALDVFLSYGFAQTEHFQEDEPSYEHRHLGRHHDHLICTRCGKVEEFLSPPLEDLQVGVARGHGFVPLYHRTDIYGLCAACARERGTAVPLSEAQKGEHMIVCGFEGGEEFKRRLMDMGICEGTEIEVLGDGGGPVVLACRGSRMALGRGMSEKIMVTPRAVSKHRSRKRWRGRLFNQHLKK
jgi:Fur family transcriptional regulator, ferric uptake regulator